jgi:dihydrofolate reductase
MPELKWLLKMEKIIIAALTNNYIIGNKGEIPWHISQDLRRFRKLTIGYPLILGRKTHESVGFLEGRLNIVVTRNRKFKSKESAGIVVCHSIKEALEEAEKYGEKVYIAGGKEIYEQTLNIVDMLELTKIHRLFEGDTYFPIVDWSKWKETYKENHKGYSFHTYKRIRKGE